MNVFAIVATTGQAVDAIRSALVQKFADKYTEAGDRLWLVSDNGTTTIEFASKLGVKGSPAGGDVTSVVILPVTSYWGNANPAIWEWIKNKLEA
jgi:hypothetical protein